MEDKSHHDSGLSKDCLKVHHHVRNGVQCLIFLSRELKSLVGDNESGKCLIDAIDKEIERIGQAINSCPLTSLSRKPRL